MKKFETFLKDEVKQCDVCLDVGCGDKSKTRWIEETCSGLVIFLDKDEKFKPDILMEAGKELFPLRNESCDVVLISDLLQELSKEEGEFVLKEAFRVCRRTIILAMRDRRETDRSVWTHEDFGSSWERVIGVSGQDGLVLLVLRKKK